MKLVVTGASGLIGRGINDVIEPVVNIDKELSCVPNLALMDIGKRDLLLQYLADFDFDCVLHLAASTRVYESTKDPYLAWGNWVTTNNIANICWVLKRPLVIASSREVFGSGAVIDEDSPHCYLSPYSWSKGMCEALVREIGRSKGLKYFIIRYSNVYGNCEYDKTGRVVTKWMKAMAKDEDVTLYGEDKRFDFTYLDDAVKVTLDVVERFLRNELSYDSCNIAGRPLFLKDLFYTLRDITGSNSSCAIEDSRAGEPYWLTVKSKYIQHKYINNKKGLKLCWEKFNAANKRNESESCFKQHKRIDALL